MMNLDMMSTTTPRDSFMLMFWRRKIKMVPLYSDSRYLDDGLSFLHSFIESHSLQMGGDTIFQSKVQHILTKVDLASD